MAQIAVPMPQRLAVAESVSVPWYIWCAVLSVTSAMVGGHWDVSWHRSIGRDTFWTPAHIAIYLCGVLCGISSAYLILSRTFERTHHDGPVVRMWGFRGPLGAFLSAWGGVAMLTSAPFDDWWHSAYGLDVKIVSPPHVLLMLGVFAIEMGTLILILGEMNRAKGELKTWLNALFLYVGAMIVVLMLVFQMEFTLKNFQHSAGMYRNLSWLLPLVLAGVARASGIRWSTTIIAAIYMVFIELMVLILPLFPAEPKLGPVYYPVTHFVPPEFPLLLVVPAFALDLLWQRGEKWNKWLLATISGVVFLGVFLAIQWPFANFLMSPASRNFFFGTHYFGYYVHPQSYIFRHLFVPVERTSTEFATQMAIAVVGAILMMRAGLGWGDWMRRIRR